MNPFAGFQLPMEGGGLTLVYEPRIFFIASSVATGTEGQEGRHVSYLHRGRLTFDWQPSERWKVFVNGRAAYGEYDFSRSARWSRAPRWGRAIREAGASRPRRPRPPCQSPARAPRPTSVSWTWWS